MNNLVCCAGKARPEYDAIGYNYGNGQGKVALGGKEPYNGSRKTCE